MGDAPPVRDRDISTRTLLQQVPHVGRLEAIQLRTALHGDVVAVQQADAITALGIAGDHRTSGREPSPAARRQVTLIQAEHLEVVAKLLGVNAVEPIATRRNLVVSGVNLASLRTARFAIGDVEFEGTGHCHPCSIMESSIGVGAFQAMRGHGGITARVLRGGPLRVGAAVRVVGPSLPDED